MKYKLSPLASDIFISAYAVVTLFLRFKYENSASVGVLNSVVIGAAFLVIIWALIKLEILNPNWFGLFKSKNSKS
tara:strand:+ start:38891 stop:39115 length:225 start_codon:yes stop_codon:yes gene_type:complete